MPNWCRCNCGEEAKVGRNYLPGHDARRPRYAVVEFTEKGELVDSQNYTTLKAAKKAEKLANQYGIRAYTAGVIWDEGYWRYDPITVGEF